MSEKIETTLEECLARLEGIRARGHETISSEEYQQHAAEVRGRVAAHEAEQLEISKRYRRKVARVPAHWWPLLDKPEERPPIAESRSFLNSHKHFLVLSGAGGEGKSFAAAWCVDQSGSAAEFLKAGELAQHGSYEPLYWRGLAERSLLALDELGQERIDKSGWFAGAFCDLLDSRQIAGKKTVFTTNLGGEHFMARYAAGDFVRLQRRWKDHGRFVRLRAEQQALIPEATNA